MLITLIAFAVLTITLILTVLFILYPRKKNISTVPGLEPTDEELGNIGEIRDAGSVHEFLVKLHEEFGSVASFWFGTQFCVSVSSASTFRDIQTLFDRPGCFFEFFKPLSGRKSIQFSNGVDGRRRHKLYSESLGHRACCNMMPKFVEIGKELASAWSALSPDEHIPVHAYMMAVAIKMVSATQFGAYFKDDEVIKRFHKLYEMVMDDLNALMLGSFSEKDTLKYEKFQSNLSQFKSEVKKFVDVHQKARAIGDYEEAPLLDSILDNAVDDEQVIDDVISFIVGGFHTTGNFLTWIIYFLTICPEIQKKMIVEVDSVLKGNDLDETSASKLVLSWQVLEETLRCSVTAPFAARVDNDREIRIQGHRIPPGTPIMNALGVSLSDEQYFPDPGKFDPERFSSDEVRKRAATAFVPFGIGPRRCPGYKFSKFEALSIVVTILQNFSFRPAFENDFFIEPSFGFVTKPESEIWINIKSRKQD